MKSFAVRNAIRKDGRTIYDDGVARAADLGEDRIVLECSGHSVECGVLQIPEAAQALIGAVGGKLSLLEASHAVLFDIEDRLDG